MKFLCVSNDETFADFLPVLAAHGEVESVSSAAAAMALVEAETFAVVCVGEELAEGSGLDFARDFARRFPLTNCALVSGLDEEEFHEASEGLGLVMQIAPAPDAAEAMRLISVLITINSLF